MVLRLLFLIILVIAIIALISPVLFILAVYKILANLCLRWRILAPMDILWDLDKDGDLPLGIITTVIAVSGGKLTFQEFKTLMQERNLHLLDPKLQCLRKLSIFGYHYWQKNEHFNLDDHIKELRCDEVVEEDEMRRILEKLNAQKLPFNHEAQWELYLGPRLKSNGEINQTIICRFHHSLGDGPALLRSIISAFIRSDEQHYLTIPEAKVEEYLQNLPEQKSICQNLLDVITATDKSFNPPNESTFLHGTSLNGRKQMAWRCSRTMMNAAKSIRKSTGASFSAGLLAAFLDALAEFRQYKDASKNVTFSLPFQTKYERQIKMANNFTFNFATFIIPKKDRDTMRHLQAVDQCLQKTKSIAVLAINSLILRVTGWLCPRPLAKFLTTTENVQMDFSNVPGPEAELSCGNLKMHKIVVWLPRIDKRIIGISVVSYNRYLNLGLNLDTAICKGPNDAEEIMALWEKHLYQIAKDLAQHQ